MRFVCRLVVFLVPVSAHPGPLFSSSPLADALKSMDNKLAKRQRAFLLFKSAFYKAYVSLVCISFKCGAEFPTHSLYTSLPPLLTLFCVLFRCTATQALHSLAKRNAVTLFAR